MTTIKLDADTIMQVCQILGVKAGDDPAGSILKAVQQLQADKQELLESVDFLTHEFRLAEDTLANNDIVLDRRL